MGLTLAFSDAPIMMLHNSPVSVWRRGAAAAARSWAPA
jgi:hypothetical protein